MTNKALAISIVIPVYNEEHHLDACLRAVAKQTVKPADVIVVNNNSTDDTLAIAKKFPFVHLLEEKQQGVGYARTKGFDAVKADIIARIDADTQIPFDWVERVEELFMTYPDMAAVSGPTGFYDLPLPRLTLFLTAIIRTGLFYAGKKDSKYLFGSNMALRRSAWQSVRKSLCHVKGIHEDNDLAIHLDKTGFLVGYSNHIPAQISVRRADDTPRQAWHYAFSEYRTYRHHGVKSIRAWLAGIILLVVYPGLKWLRRLFDPDTRRLSLKHARIRPVPRPDPMD